MANLLPPSKYSIIKSSKSGIIKPEKFLNAKTKTTTVGVKNQQKESPKLLEDTITKIERKVIQIDKLLKDSLFISKKDIEKKRKGEEKKEFEEREKQLEKKKPPKVKGINLPTPPRMGFLDWIKNFITQTVLGFFAVRLIDYLPKLLNLLPTIIKVTDFITDVGGKMLDGLITFIDWGYKAYDATRGFIKNIGGEGLAKNLDTFAGALNGLLDAAIIAAIAASSMGGDGGSGGPTTKIKGAAKQAGRSRYGTSASAARRYVERFGKDAASKRFGQKGVESLGGKYARSALSNATRNAFVGRAGKGGAKTILKFVKPLVNKIPIIGGLLEFGLSWALGEPVGKAAFRGIGSVLVGAIGTAIGGPVGAFLGSWAGGEAGGVLYDMFFNNKKPPKGKTVKAAGGGKTTTRGGKPISPPTRRTLRKKKRSRATSFTPTKIKPGRNTGGEDKVQKVFPNPKKSGGLFAFLFGGGNKQQQPEEQKKPKEKSANPQEFLIKSNDILGKADFFGPFFTLAYKAVLGDKPNKLDYIKAGKGLNAWMQGTFKTGVLGFAGGGEVDARQFFEGEDFTNVIAKSVEDSVSKEVNTTIRDLAKELTLRPVGRDEMLEYNRGQKAPSPEDMGEGANIQVSSDSKDFWLLATAAMFENSNPQGAADVAQVIYNRTQYSAWNAPTIRKAILNPNQFQPVRQYGGTAAWSAIKTKEDAIRFSKSHGKTQAQLERVAAALLDKSMQSDARSFVGPRDSFRADAYEKANNHLADETEKSRHGHTFGFEPGGAMIGQFKAGKLSAAQVNANVTGSVNLKPGDGKFIQGNSGRSGGTHFHIGTNKPGDGSGVAAAGFNVVKHFLGKKSVYVGRSGETIPAGATDEQIRGYIARGQAAHRKTELDLQIGGTGAGNKVAFPLALKGMKYSATDGYGVSADIVGTNAFVGHGRYKPDGTLAPQQKLVLNAGAPDFYAFHGMNKLMSKDGLLKFHKGEYISVTDADSFRLVGNILTDINSIENKSQLVAKVPSIIEKLKAISGYTDYENPEPEVAFIPMPMPESGGVSGGASKSSMSIDYSTIDTYMSSQMGDQLMYG